MKRNSHFGWAVPIQHPQSSEPAQLPSATRLHSQIYNCIWHLTSDASFQLASTKMGSRCQFVFLMSIDISCRVIFRTKNRQKFRSWCVTTQSFHLAYQERVRVSGMMIDSPVISTCILRKSESFTHSIWKPRPFILHTKQSKSFAHDVWQPCHFILQIRKTREFCSWPS